MIKQLTIDHLEPMYEIWKAGTFVTFSSDTLDISKEEAFYKKLFTTRINEQDSIFKIWGYFENEKLIGWQSILPCRSAPFVFKNYAESSTYVNANLYDKGIGTKLLQYAINDARENSELMYVTAYISERNHRIHKVASEVGFQRIGILPRSKKDKILPEIAFWIVPL